ncbi:MAG TPA: hypothetical protein VGM44_24410 [Polyangiaceae bacterium]
MSKHRSWRGRHWGTLAALVGSGAVCVASCSDDSTRKHVLIVDAGNEAAAGAPDASGGAFGMPESSGGAAGAPIEAGGAAGESSAGAAGVSSAAGAAGSASCADTCVTGGCVFDQCLPALTIANDINLSTTALTVGRTCAEAPAYSVLALSGSVVTLSDAPAAGCVSAGDEFLLINLQGTDAANANVGNWELLRLGSAAGKALTFSTPITGFYGNSANNNNNLGLAATNQRVALIRVPRFGHLIVNAGVTVTANAWDGVLGGVLVLRAGKLDLGGTLSAAALGYRAARWSMDASTCSNNVPTEAGESIGGTGTASTLHNLGASGGLSALNNVSFNSDNVVLSTPGHAQAGVVGFNGKGRTIGEPGAAYGSADATQLTLGSGPGGALECTTAPTAPTPYLYVGNGGQAGGIAFVLADDLKVAAGGAISASPPDAPRDITFSGGYVFVRGTTLALGANRVTALGSTGTVPLGPDVGMTNQASPGYVVLDAATVTGTTNPSAHWLGH